MAACAASRQQRHARTRIFWANCVFRSNHASNYVALKGMLPASRARMIGELRAALAAGSFKEAFRLL
jgi:hypothetical protein